nr:hypothetical protein [Tanacetum cinerariifolium]
MAVVMVRKSEVVEVMFGCIEVDILGYTDFVLKINFEDVLGIDSVNGDDGKWLFLRRDRRDEVGVIKYRGDPFISI